MAGSFGDWLDVFSYNMNYAAGLARPEGVLQAVRLNFISASDNVFEVTMTMRILLGVGILSLLYVPFLRRHAYLPVAVSAAFAMEFIGTMVSPLRIAHYYMQVVPSFVLLSAYGADFAKSIVANLKIPEWVLVILVALSLFVFDFDTCDDYLNRLKAPQVRAQVGPVAKYIMTNSRPDDTIWATSGHNSRFYIETRRLSPTKYFYLLDWTFLDTMKSTGEEKKALVAADLRRSPPKFIVMNRTTTDYIRSLGLRRWMNLNYVKTDVQDGPVSLYERVYMTAEEEARQARIRARVGRAFAVPLPAEIARVDTTIDRIGSFRFIQEPLHQALGRIAAYADFSVTFDSDAKIVQGRLVTETLSGVTVCRAFEALLEPMGLAYVLTGEGVRIVRKEAAGQPVLPGSGEHGKAADTGLLEIRLRRKSRCLDFDGKAASVIVPWAPSMDISGPLTVEAWVYYRGPSSLPAAIITRDAPDLGPFEIGITSNGRLWSNVAWGNWNTQPEDIQLPALPRDRWVHVALVYDRKKARTFIDGKLVFEYRTAPQLLLNRNPLRIGTKIANGTTIRGKIDEVRLSSCARYLRNFEPAPRFQPDKSTIALYHFDAGSGITAYDASGNGNHGEIYDAQWSPK